MNYDIGCITTIGNVRKSNQDRIFVQSMQRDGESCALLAVADGMGGLNDGDKASTLVVRKLSEWWRQQTQLLPIQQTGQLLDAVLYEAHREIYYQSEYGQRPSGTTLTLFWQQGQHYCIKQIGDSRAYAITPEGLRQLTVDQTWYNQKVRSGELTPEQAAQDRRSKALVNAVGVSSELNIETQFGCCQPGDFFLLCSDGFYKEAPLAELVWNKLQKQQMQDVLQSQIACLLQGPARDNASAILCRLL